MKTVAVGDTARAAALLVCGHKLIQREEVSDGWGRKVWKWIFDDTSSNATSDLARYANDTLQVSAAAYAKTYVNLYHNPNTGEAHVPDEPKAAKPAARARRAKSA